MNSMQNGKVPETSGEGNNFEGHMLGTNEIDKNHVKYLLLLTCQNRHVRQTTGNVMRAQRSKIE